MMYLYVPGPDFNEGRPWQSRRGPSGQYAQMIIDGEIEIFRFNNHVEQLVPIDSQDFDSWNIVEGDDETEVTT